MIVDRGWPALKNAEVIFLKIKKLLLSALVGVSILATDQSAFAAPFSSKLETSDISPLTYTSIQMNQYYMGYISGYDVPIGSYWDIDDRFKWTNNTDHDIAIEVWLFSPYGLHYDLFMDPPDDGQIYSIFATEKGQYSYIRNYGRFGPKKPNQQIIIKPGITVNFIVSQYQSILETSSTKNYVLWINEIPIEK
ncbi:hypothetical protein ACFPYJ_15000 [Paenibacillus solisilvae]|uniref:Uncharacterized protein n=1 Tax=Paenibacillus solisilvae TaxID=2486751 RepID=A0ABW0W066_9BACL